MGLTYFMGLDLGKEQDHTAFAVLEERQGVWCDELNDYVLYDEDCKTGTGRDTVHFHVNNDKKNEELGLVHLSQIPLHTEWAAVAGEVEGLIGRCLKREKRSDIQLWVDATGIGDPIIEAYLKPIHQKYKNCFLRSVKIVSGDGGYKPKDKSVSKIHLVDNATVMRERKEFSIAKDLRDKPVIELFEKQIQSFKRKEGKRAGTILYEGMGEHDDLIIAFALACLGVKHRAQRGRVFI